VREAARQSGDGDGQIAALVGLHDDGVGAHVASLSQCCAKLPGCESGLGEDRAEQSWPDRFPSV
jgi:hypothetical protein